jgi:hypothetical protein
MTTPAVYADHVWQKFEAFEGILSKEMTAGRHGDRYASLQYRADPAHPDVWDSITATRSPPTMTTKIDAALAAMNQHLGHTRRCRSCLWPAPARSCRRRAGARLPGHT